MMQQFCCQLELAVSGHGYQTLAKQCQDPECNVPAFAGAGTVTDPAISPFHIRTTSINGTRNNDVSVQYSIDYRPVNEYTS